MVLVSVYFPIEVSKAELFFTMENYYVELKYPVGKFLSFITSMVKEDEILNLSYDPTNEREFEVIRLEGTGEYDIIKINAYQIRVPGGYLQFSFIRENRPPDANTVHVLNPAGEKSDFVLYSEDATVVVQNYATYVYDLERYYKGELDEVPTVMFCDADEDDKYSDLDYSFRFGSFFTQESFDRDLLELLSQYGSETQNQQSPQGDEVDGESSRMPTADSPNADNGFVTERTFDRDFLDSLNTDDGQDLSTISKFDSCDVGSDLIVTISDDGGLSDVKTFVDFVRCDADTGDKNSCCGPEGLWSEGLEGGCTYGKCAWVDVETCTYKVCQGGFRDDEVEMTAVVKQSQNHDICDSCGDCVCGTGNPQFKTMVCPQSTLCPEEVVYEEPGDSGFDPCADGGCTTPYD